MRALMPNYVGFCFDGRCWSSGMIWRWGRGKSLHNAGETFLHCSVISRQEYGIYYTGTLGGSEPSSLVSLVTQNVCLGCALCGFQSCLIDDKIHRSLTVLSLPQVAVRSWCAFTHLWMKHCITNEQTVESGLIVLSVQWLVEQKSFRWHMGQSLFFLCWQLFTILN